MALDDRTAQEQLTPDERRSMLRAFADRMLLKMSAMDDPEDMPGVERAVRVGAVIERIYSRCDRAEKHAPDPNRIEADRARNLCDALKNRHNMITTLDWAEDRRKGHGVKWDAAQDHLKAQHVVPSPVRFAAAPVVAVKADPAPRRAPQKPAPAKPETAAKAVATATPLPGLPQTPPKTPQVTVTDMTDIIHRARAAMGLPDMSAFDTPPGPKQSAPPRRSTSPP